MRADVGRILILVHDQDHDSPGAGRIHGRVHILLVLVHALRRDHGQGRALLRGLVTTNVEDMSIVALFAVVERGQDQYHRPIRLDHRPLDTAAALMLVLVLVLAVAAQRVAP